LETNKKTTPEMGVVMFWYSRLSEYRANNTNELIKDII
jgi:hypothetical protein